MTTDEKGYNGWANYETWATGLWIGNEQGSYQQAEQLTRRAKSPYDLAQALKDWIEEDNPLGDQATLYSDLLSAAISEVDWLEIAEHYWEDFKDEDEEEVEEEEE